MRRWIWGNTDLGFSAKKKSGMWYGQYWFRGKITEEQPFGKQVDAIRWCKDKESGVVERLRWGRGGSCYLPQYRFR